MWRNLVEVALCYPAGVLADRWGSRPVLIAGYALGALTATLTLLAFALDLGTIPFLALLFFVAGAYVAVQETVESTLTAEMVTPETLTTSYGALGAVNGGAKFASSAAVGLLWSATSPIAGFGLAAGLMALGTAALVITRPD